VGNLDIKLKVDASGLSCPLPILKATQGIKSVASGELIEVVATDPSSVKDFDCLVQVDRQRHGRAGIHRRQVPLRSSPQVGTAVGASERRPRRELRRERIDK